MYYLALLSWDPENEVRLVELRCTHSICAAVHVRIIYQLPNQSISHLSHTNNNNNNNNNNSQSHSIMRMHADSQLAAVCIRIISPSRRDVA